MKNSFHCPSPQHWFRPICTAHDELEAEPQHIEYLKMWTGETFIHVFGTVYWHTYEDGSGCLDMEALLKSGITHWRIPSRAATQAVHAA